MRQAVTPKKLGGVNFSFNEEDGTATVVEGGDYSGSIVIPAEVLYEGRTYRVTAIGDYAFGYCDQLTSVTLPSTVETIGECAFRDCYCLTSVTLPEGLTSIGSSAFQTCEILTSIVIPEGVTSIGNLEDPKERTAERLLEMLSFDFFQVLDAVTIARSRKHIEKYYDTADIGKFPTRLRPISKRPHLTDLDEAITYRDIDSQLDELNLSVYAPSDYILPSMRSKYEIDKDDSGGHLGMSGREKGLKKLIAINLLKRLESSVNSFRLTLERMKSQVDETLKAIGWTDRCK